MSDINEEEIWKDVVGYEGLYKVSNLGNVYSNYVHRNLKQGNHKDGYKFVILNRNGKSKYMSVHRLVATAFIPKYEYAKAKLSKKVNQYDLDGNFIQSFPSTREAGKQLKFSSSLIAGVCRGNHKHTHGYIFKYA